MITIKHQLDKTLLMLFISGKIDYSTVEEDKKSRAYAIREVLVEFCKSFEGAEKGLDKITQLQIELYLTKLFEKYYNYD